MLNTLSNIWAFIKKNVVGLAIGILGLLAFFFKEKADKAESSLQVATADKTDAVLAQKQTDIQSDVATVEQQEKTQENQPHTQDEDVDFLKKL